LPVLSFPWFVSLVLLKKHGLQVSSWIPDRGHEVSAQLLLPAL